MRGLLREPFRLLSSSGVPLRVLGRDSLSSQRSPRRWVCKLVHFERKGPILLWNKAAPPPHFYHVLPIVLRSLFTQDHSFSPSFPNEQVHPYSCSVCETYSKRFLSCALPLDGDAPAIIDSCVATPEDQILYLYVHREESERNEWIWLPVVDCLYQSGQPVS